MNTLLKLKQFFFTVFLASIFASSIQAQDLDMILLKDGIGKMIKNYKAKEYDIAIASGDYVLINAKTPAQKYLVVNIRAMAIKARYVEEWRAAISNSEFADKYSIFDVPKLKMGIDDALFILNYLETDPSATAKEKSFKGSALFDLGLFYLYLADRSTHDRADYANAEKYLNLAASEVKDDNPSFFLPRALAAQGKLDAARREATRQLAISKNYAFAARRTITDFDFAGEFYLGDAVLLSEASRLKAQGKPLTDLTAAAAQHQKNLKDIAGFSEPTTALELNRQGAMFYLMKQPEKAAEVLERAAQMGNNPTALRWLTLVRLQQQNFPAAETLAAKILATNPTDTIGLTARGLIAVTKNDFARAEKDLTQAIDAFPEAALFANTYKTLALVYQKQNKTTEMNEILAKQKTLGDLYAEAKSARS